MPTVNSNSAAMFALNKMTVTERDMTQAMERLSSGKRINHAGDDAAGGAIASRMTAQIKGLDMSVRNASDTISLAQVAEGALDESAKVLQRIREFAIQSASDVMNAEERSYLDQEVIQMLAELDRVTRDTTFNEIAVLDGSFADRRFQIGTHEREKAVISVANMRIDKIGAFQSSTSMDEAGTAGNLASEGVVGANKAGAASRVTTNDDLTITGLVGQATVGLEGEESAKRIVELVNNKFDNTGVSATATTTIKIEVNSGDAPGDHVVGFNLYGKNTDAQTISATISVGSTTGASDLSNLRDAINAYTANTGIRATLSADKTNIIIVQDEGEDVVIEDVDFATVTYGNTKFTFTAMSQDQTDEAATQITTVTDTQHGASTDSVRFTGQITFHSSQTFTISATAGEGLFEAAPGTATLNKVSTIDIRTVSGAVDALKVIDRALDRVHMERAKFGAIMSLSLIHI